MRAPADGDVTVVTPSRGLADRATAKAGSLSSFMPRRPPDTPNSDWDPQGPGSRIVQARKKNESLPTFVSLYNRYFQTTKRPSKNTAVSVDQTYLRISCHERPSPGASVVLSSDDVTGLFKVDEQRTLIKMAAVPSVPSTDGTHDQTAISVVSGDASAAGAVGTGTPAEFFSSLRLDRDALQRLQKESSRQACVHCGKSRKFFCFDCHCLVGLEGGKDVPVLQLPIKVDIVKHWNERNSKSTAVHAKLVAPDQVTIHTFPEVPDLGDTSGTVLLYPCPDAVDIAAVDPASVTRVVFVDSTWSQCSSILAHPTLAKLRRVQIASEHTLFWRPQSKKPSTHLATIEAIYHFFKQLPQEKGDSVTQYDGR